jgi:hypothetical protein
MKKLFSALALLLIAVSTFSQPTGIGIKGPFDVESERDRIQADRTRAEARYEREEAACYARFAVTNCLHEVRARRREELADLRRQEIVLNDAERKRKALEQLERIQQKSSAQGLEEEAARRAQALEARQEREERANQKASAAMKAKSGLSTGRGTQKTVEQGRTADDAASEQKQYSDKLKEAQEHRASREKINSEKSGTSSKPLPPTP